MTKSDDLHIEHLLKSEKNNSWGIIVHWFAGILCLGAALIIILHFGELEQLLEAIKHIRPAWIVLAVLVQVCSYASATGVWYLILIASGYLIPFRSLYPLTIAQLFARQALPSNGLSGALLVIKGLFNRGVAEPIGMGCIVVGMVSYYAAYILAILISVAMIGFHHKLSVWLVAMAMVFCVVCIVTPAAILWLRALNIRHKLPAFIQRRKALAKILDVLAQSPMDLLKNRSLLVKTIALQLTIFFIDSATLLIMLYAVGYGQPYDIVFASLVMSSVMGAIMPVPLGLGAFEGTCVAMLHVFGLPVEPALVAVLLLRGFNFWLPMIPGLWLVKRELHNSKDTASEHAPE